jgi:hypothetical protein
VSGAGDLSHADLSRADLIALALEQADTIAGQAQTIARQDETIAGLLQRVAELERRLSRNSGNSSMPPSTDDLPGRTGPAPREGKKPKRGRGKQPGAAGSALGWVDDPDQTVPHFPAGRCGCGADLADAADAGVVRSHQVHEIPLVTVRVIQHDLHQVRCDCGTVHTAEQPEQVSAAPASYGENLQALVVYLLVFQHVPVGRCAQLIADLTGAKPSTGFVHGMLTRAAGVLDQFAKLVKTAITLAHVVGFDETTLRAGKAGTKKYVLSASTEWCTAFFLGGRDLASFKDFGILPAFTGIAVHDRYSLYDHRDFPGPAGHQLCGSHLLRDLADAAEVYPGQHWPQQAARSLRRLIGAWHDARDAGQAQIPTAISAPLVDDLRQAALVGLSYVPRRPGANTKQPPARLLLECLRDRQDDVLRFCTDTRIWPTNNISERDLRPLKTQQKISGRLTSEDVTRDRLTIRGYVSTAVKHGINVMTALRDAIAGMPWTPPEPAPT